jgi:hypothetical protein
MITGDSYIGSNRQHRLSDQVSANTFHRPGQPIFPPFLLALQPEKLPMSLRFA